MKSNTENYVEESPSGRYKRTDTILGKGSYKIVYNAFDSHTGKIVAWNRVSVRYISNKNKKRVSNEVILLDKMSHPNIINLLGTWYKDHNVYFITQKFDHNLTDFVNNNEYSLGHIKKWCNQILNAYIYIHSNHVVHRDVKPDNIFINLISTDIVLGDFGIYLNTETADFESIGTIEYMAPEMFEEKPKYDESIDIYSFGMLLSFLLTKTEPYKDNVIGEIIEFKNKNLYPNNFKIISNNFPLMFNLIMDLVEHNPIKRPTPLYLLETGVFNSESSDFLVKIKKMNS